MRPKVLTLVTPSLVDTTGEHTFEFRLDDAAWVFNSTNDLQLPINLKTKTGIVPQYKIDISFDGATWQAFQTQEALGTGRQLHINGTGTDIQAAWIRIVLYNVHTIAQVLEVWFAYPSSVGGVDGGIRY